MTPQEIESIVHCLVKRVTPRDAEEGVALYKLAQKLAAHFAPKPTPKPAAEGAPMSDMVHRGPPAQTELPPVNDHVRDETT